MQENWECDYWSCCWSYGQLRKQRVRKLTIQCSLTFRWCRLERRGSSQGRAKNIKTKQAKEWGQNGLKGT